MSFSQIGKIRYPLPTLAPSGIKYCDRMFTNPVRFNFMVKPPGGGIYVVLVSDPTCKPRPYRPLYFGEAEYFFRRVMRSHEKYADWTKEARGGELYVAFFAMPGSTKEARLFVEDKLISDYAPPCNDRFNNSALIRTLYGI